MSDDIETMLTDALQRDADAISRMAQMLRERSPENVRAQSTQVASDIVARNDFQKAAEEFKREFADVAQDPLAWARAKELDLAESRANTPESRDVRARLRRVGEQVRQERADTYERASREAEDIAAEGIAEALKRSRARSQAATQLDDPNT
jgi:hypothetical protein